MTADLRPARARDLLVAFTAGATLLCASLVNFLRYNDYPLFRPEVGLLIAGLLATCAAMTFLYRPKWSRPILEGLLAALFLDFNTDSWPLILAGAMGVAAVTAWFKISLLGQMAVLGSIVLLATLVGLGDNPRWISTTKGDALARSAPGKPAIVHIVLDEHLGLDALESEGLEARALRGELRRFYLDRGFAVYGGAYSQHYHSANSIPYILNFGSALAHTVQVRGIRSGPTRHLQNLVRQGYRLTIFQSDYADFCTGANFHECVTYNSSSPRPTLAAPLSILDRSSLILHKFLTLSDISILTLFEWNRITAKARRDGVPLPSYHWLLGSSSSIGTLQAFGELSRRLKDLRPGEAVFAHLLLPHHPYVVRRDCSYLPWPWEGLRTEASREVKLAAYGEQMRCTTRKIDLALQAISRSPAASNVVVILHGDHGSRISEMGASDQAGRKYSDRDLIQVFSTLFAIRAPGVSAAYYEERQPVASLLRDFASSGFRSAPHPKPPSEHWVYLTNSAMKPASRIAMPTSWTKASKRPSNEPAQR